MEPHTLPTTHTEWLSRSHAQYAKTANDWEARAEEARTTREKHVRVLSEAFAEYVMTGVGRQHDESLYIREGQRGGFFWRKYFRALARDMKRPFVWFSVGSGSFAELHIAKRKYCAPLMSSLWLVGSQSDTVIYHYNRYHGCPSDGVYYQNISDHTEFWFRGEQAVAIAKAHVASFHVDPDKRRALRL
jgi:hypothetical protein